MGMREGRQWKCRAIPSSHSTGQDTLRRGRHHCGVPGREDREESNDYSIFGILTLRQLTSGYNSKTKKVKTRI